MKSGKRLVNTFPKESQQQWVAPAMIYVQRNGIVWIGRSGAPWRDLPERYGDWNTVYKRFAKWQEENLFEIIFNDLGVDADLQDLSIDSTSCKEHQHSAGAKKGAKTAKQTNLLDWAAVAGTQKFMPSWMGWEIPYMFSFQLEIWMMSLLQKKFYPTYPWRTVLSRVTKNMAQKRYVNTLKRMEDHIVFHRNLMNQIFGSVIGGSIKNVI